MKKNSKSSKKQKNARIRSLISKAHVLIAVVAIIECLILISFTTYSWIETASSLIIKTGHKYYEDTVDTRIPIANAYNYKFVVNNSTPNMSDVADLNKYFSYSGESSTQNLYRFARASSANGKDFFFPSPTNPDANKKYRAGDIIDSNANYAHFDFVVSNTGAAKEHKLKFYFDEAAVFTVTNDSANLNTTQLNNIKNAMRISFQTGSGTPKIYSQSAMTYNAVNTTTGGTASVTTTVISADENQKLFTVGKNSEQSISVRIWLEEKSAGISSLTSDQLSGVNININLKLRYKENDYDFIYFDDYTFSSGKLNKNNIGGHLTEDFAESDTYRMYFVYSENGTTKYYYPMTRDNSGSNADANCWVTCDSSGTASSTVPDLTAQPYITRLTASGQAALNNSYFAYGAYPKAQVNVTTAPSSAPLYTWKLNGANASASGELRYSGYSVTNTAAGSANAYGVGGWSYNTPLSMVYFRDLATSVTSSAYNNGTNFKYVTSAVNADSDTGSGNRSDVMYVNNGLAQLTDALKVTQAPSTATMYFDKSMDNGNGLFKSWVPTSWLTSTMRFSYCPDGYWSNCCVTWYTTNPSKPASTTDYIYTALGCSENYEVSYYSGSLHSGRNDWINVGTGTWREIESAPVYFTTELIDQDVTSAFRYQIGVMLDGASTYSYYHLIPDETNMKFYAYLPKAGTNASPADDYAKGAIVFRSFASHNTAVSAKNGYWLTNQRKGSDTYHPVALDASDTTTDYTRGYWNISVIVDGTYEHFFWDTRVESDPDDDGVLGSFSYNTTGHTGSPTYTDITPNKIDEYRWYVPLDDLTTIPEYIYYKWEPYTGTVFTYSQKLSDGIYCVITEAGDTTPTNAFD